MTQEPFCYLYPQNVLIHDKEQKTPNVLGYNWKKCRSSDGKQVAWVLVLIGLSRKYSGKSPPKNMMGGYGYVKHYLHSAVNNGLLDTYQLKSLDGLLEADLSEDLEIKRRADNRLAIAEAYCLLLCVCTAQLTTACWTRIN